MFLKKNIDVDVFDDVLQNSKHRAYDASNDVNHQPLPGGGGQLTGVKCFQAVRVKWVKTPQRKRFYCSIFIFGWKKKNILRSKGSRGHIMIIKNRYIYRSVEHQKVVSIIKDKIG